MSSVIGVLGGTGRTGRLIVELLLKRTDCSVVILGRSKSKADSLTVELAANYTRRITYRYADAAKPETLKDAFTGVSLLLDCGTTTEAVEGVARAALDAGCDWLDIHYPERVIAVLERLKPEIEAKGRIFITQAGIHPGLPGALLRLMALEHPELAAATIAMLIRQKVIGTIESTAEVFGDITKFEMERYANGKWEKATYRDAITFDFGEPFNRQSCIPMKLEELRPLPQELGLKSLTFCAAGFNWFVDWVVFPLATAAIGLAGKAAVITCSRLMMWGMKQFTRPPFGCLTIIEGEARGVRHRISVFHNDGYMLTAIAVVACVRQYQDNIIGRPGLFLMGRSVNPGLLLEEMQSLGATISRS